MHVKCSECGQDVEVCNVCQLKIHESQRAVKLEFDNGRRLWGPFHFECIGNIDLNIVNNDLNPLLHSRDMTDRHDMRPLLDDLRTRPTEPPEAPKKGDYPNPRCEKRLKNGPDEYVQCDYVRNHQGNHYHQYNEGNGYSWDDNVSA